MTTKSRATVRITWHFKASPESMFDAWTDPNLAWTWMARAAGQIVCIEIDPRVHGAVRQVVRRDGHEVEYVGEYVELARPTRLAFTWPAPPFSDDRSLVKLDFRPVGTGTDLTLAQERVQQGRESRTMDGWRAILDAISVGLARRNS